MDTVEGKQWTVRVHITEDGDETRARAVLSGRDTSSVAGTGVAHRNPDDPPAPEVGDELAACRALEDLAARLRDLAADGAGRPPAPARAWSVD
ncbi:DUF1876 domain-containing protein [Streptomyces galbus]|uniref:DUF1876 domain-containing protein n=1 Tax=Streptomyces galbus TaxID=33898 RepID=A0A4U5X3K6_STRGB|nr:DUF1876 domain-containing protein [Streptomyces galbus]